MRCKGTCLEHDTRYQLSPFQVPHTLNPKKKNLSIPTPNSLPIAVVGGRQGLRPNIGSISTLSISLRLN